MWNYYFINGGFIKKQQNKLLIFLNWMLLPVGLTLHHLNLDKQILQILNCLKFHIRFWEASALYVRKLGVRILLKIGGTFYWNLFTQNCSTLTGRKMLPFFQSPVKKITQKCWSESINQSFLLNFIQNLIQAECMSDFS